MSAPRQIRQDVVVCDGGQCQKCGTQQGLDARHIVPTWKGGNDDHENMVTLCAICNDEWAMVSAALTISFDQWLPLPPATLLITAYLTDWPDDVTFNHVKNAIETVHAKVAPLANAPVLARREALHKRERSKREGEKIGWGRLPFGYVRTDQGVIIDPESGEVIRYIFAQREQGASLRGIAAELQRNQIPGPQGGAWGPSLVKTILDNGDVYRGIRRSESAPAWPIILEEVEPEVVES